MKLLRTILFKKSFVILAGIAFLNLSFIQAELKIFEVEGSKTWIQYLMTTGLEEETESEKETGENDRVKEALDLSLAHHLLHYRTLLVSNNQRNKYLGHLALHPGYKENFSPPPELLFS